LVERLVDGDKVEDEESTVRIAMQKYANNVERFLKENPSLITRI